MRCSIVRLHATARCADVLCPILMLQGVKLNARQRRLGCNTELRAGVPVAANNDGYMHIAPLMSFHIVFMCGF